ncbi:MAG: hypothetical protein WC891_02980 [Actinomycetota bacterium]
MTVQIIASQHRQVAVDIVEPAAQTSANAYAAITGGDVDARMWRSVAMTVLVATNTIKWTVYGANASNFSDEVVVQAEAVVAVGAAGTYAVAQAPYSYYRAKIASNVADTHGVVTYRAILKG